MVMIRTSAFAILCLLAAAPAAAQWRPLGLSGHHVNRLLVHEGFLYACTNDGLHRRAMGDPDTLWSFAGFAGGNVLDLIGLGPLTLLAAKALTPAPEDTISLFRSVDGVFRGSRFKTASVEAARVAVRLGEIHFGSRTAPGSTVRRVDGRSCGGYFV